MLSHQTYIFSLNTSPRPPHRVLKAQKTYDPLRSRYTVHNVISGEKVGQILL